MTRRQLFLSASAGLIVAVAAAVAPRAAGIPPLAPVEARADRVLIEKDARRLTLFRGGEAIAVYHVALGFTPEGDKAREGDGRTPEGVYRVDRRNDRSAYRLSLGLSYPTPDQRAAAAREGRDPGGDIFIHGQPNALPAGLTLPGDWTAGCIAVGKRAIREIWSLVPLGAEVEIRP